MPSEHTVKEKSGERRSSDIVVC